MTHPGKKTAKSLAGKLEKAGLAVRNATLPEGVKDPNELLVNRNGEASEILQKLFCVNRNLRCCFFSLK